GGLNVGRCGHRCYASIEPALSTRHEMQETRRVVWGFAAVSALLLCGVQTISAQSATALPEQDRVLARDIFKELIETNTQDSDGSVTAAAEKMRQRLLDAGFPV